MAHQFTIAAESRRDAGKGASRRLRREGKIPGIMYGGGQTPTGVAFDANALHRNMAQEAFLSSILTVTLDGKNLQAVVRDYQAHPAKRAILHLDLQRVAATDEDAGARRALGAARKDRVLRQRGHGIGADVAVRHDDLVAGVGGHVDVERTHLPARREHVKDVGAFHGNRLSRECGSA